MIINPNDPAYPGFKSIPQKDYIEQVPMEGLTIRAYFAGMAMQGLLASGDFVAPLVAQRAVSLADELIARLNIEVPEKAP